MSDEVVIVSAARTPIGKLGGTLASLNAVQLGVIAAQAAIDRAQIDPATIQQTIFGNVLQAGSGQNVARQIERAVGIPDTSTAMTVNQVCGSSLKAIRLGQAAILTGDAEAVLVGGTESMTQAPFLSHNLRLGHKFGDVSLIDSLAHDGLTDAFLQAPMGVTAETIAQRFQVSRDQQDAFALASHQKATAAMKAHRFNAEIIPVTIPGRQGPVTIAQDEGIRPDTSLKALARLKPAFQSAGTVTAGNSAGLNDGAAALILMKKSVADRQGLPYLATITGYQETGIDPAIMGYAPVATVTQLLAKRGLTIADIDRFELNEAFASQSVAVSRDLKIPAERLNVNGGAIALGHPIGTSGTRIIVSLLSALQQSQTHRGLATMCVGGGMGLAMLIERP